MRADRFSTAVVVPAALALLGLIVTIARPAEFIVQLSATPEARATARGARLVDRLAATGATLTRRLDAGLPRVTALRAQALRNRASAVPLDLLDFDPARVWLITSADSTATAALLASDPGVDWAEPNATREACVLPSGFPNDPLFRDSRQWALRNAGPGSAYDGTTGADVHALEAWSYSVGSNDLLLAVADTGVDPNQPELATLMPDGRPRLAYGLNVTFEPVSAWADSYGHGTPVAGVMAALTNDGVHGDSMGVAGVCGGDGALNRGCRLVPIKIAPGHSGNATSFDIARAILHATSVGARAMNLSFAGGAPSRAERAALYWAITHGCVPVAASGNLGSYAPTVAQYPAAYAADGLCIQVGASDMNDQRAVFSSYGPGLDLVAPGVSIWTTYLTYPSAFGVLRNGYVAGSGTSFAAPHVTGAVGLLAARRPELMDVDFQHLLRESADDIGAPGRDAPTAFGRLNLGAALRAIADSDLVVIHDEIGGQTFVPLDTDTLVVGEEGPGAMEQPRTWLAAERWEITARVPFSRAFSDTPRVWPRVGGTMTVRGDYALPYFAPRAEIVARDAGGFTLRGYVYRVPPSCPTCEDGWIPVPPDQARFGYTVIGHAAAPAGTQAGPAPIDAPLAVWPNPMLGEARFAGPAGGVLEILDVGGRRVRRLDAQGGRWTWDGRTDHGGVARPGLYFARVADASNRDVVRFIKLASP